MTVLVTGLSHHTAAHPVLERFALTRSQAAALLGLLARSPAPAESVVLATCNRVEIYAESDRPDRAADEAVRALAETTGAPAADVRPLLYTHRGPDAVAHLFRVVSGLDSMALGEPQIRGQVRAAYRLATDHGTAGPVLHDLFQHALRTGKRVETTTGVAHAAADLVGVALEAATDLLGPLSAHPTVIVGAGALGSLTVAALRRGEDGDGGVGERPGPAADGHPAGPGGVPRRGGAEAAEDGAGDGTACRAAVAGRGGTPVGSDAAGAPGTAGRAEPVDADAFTGDARAARPARADATAGGIVVVNRGRAAAERLAGRYGVRAAGLDELPALLARAGLVVAATGAGTPVITAELVAAARAGGPGHPLVLVDLSLPRNVEPAAARQPGVRLVDLAGLEARLKKASARVPVDEARRIVAEETAAFLTGRHLATVTPLIVAMRNNVLSIAEAEVDRLLGRTPALADHVRGEVARTARRIAEKIVHRPTVRVREMAAQPDGHAYVAVVHDLFGGPDQPAPPGPATGPAGRETP
ncbi:glutamyl-tRNA reductase [Streptomyces mobaraensis]|uniref:glutamyl-tRNA reductase n=1 Tax=Streptomyces mobaraensis TaxID=35621 RepID=UPI003323A820